MDMSQYLDVFMEESKEHLTNLNDKVLDLEKKPDDIVAINEIFRAAHTLKGMSSTMGFEDVADLTHHMENVLSDVKEQKLQVNGRVIDVLFQCFDRLQSMIERIEKGDHGRSDNSDLISILDHIKTGVVEEARMQNKEIAVEESDAVEQEVTVSFNEYDMALIKEASIKGFKIIYIKIAVDPTCVMKAVRSFMVFKALEEGGEIIKSIPPAQDLDEGNFDEEFEIVYLTQLQDNEIKQYIEHISEIKIVKFENITLENLLHNKQVKQQNQINQEAKEDESQEPNQKAHIIKKTVRVDIERLDNLMNLVGELVMHKGRLEQIGSAQKMNDLNETIEQIDRISTDLQSVVMKVRMVPIEQVFNRFPRMVRDLAKELNKEVNFQMEGKETELDRTVIDEIGDPLVHLLRNSIDHGLESSQERVAKGKASVGNLMLRARHEGNNVYIEVEDDGAGINLEKIAKKALSKGMITEREVEQFSSEEAIQLLFTSGFSTAERVTDVSGRGVGLDVVKSKIEAISGEIFVDTKAGEGTRFRIKLPLTLAIIQALMVAVKDEIYAIPLSSVDETTMISRKDIKMVQNQEVIMLRGNVLPLFRLDELLEATGEQRDDDEMYVVIVRKAEQQIGLMVDTLIGQQEIVIKSLGRILGGIPGIAGAIVAGDGNVRLILDITTLF